MIGQLVVCWLLAALVLILPAGYFPPVLRRLFRAAGTAVVLAALCLCIASFYYMWPDCAEVPWWVLWCDFGNVNP